MDLCHRRIDKALKICPAGAQPAHFVLKSFLVTYRKHHWVDLSDWDKEYRSVFLHGTQLSTFWRLAKYKITLFSAQSAWQRVAYCPCCCLNSGSRDKFFCYRELCMTLVPKLVRGNASLHRWFLYESKSRQCHVLRDNITFLSSISKITDLCKGFVNVNPGLWGTSE